MQVEITQYIQPHGEQRQRFCEVPDDCAVGYEALRRKRCRLTAEVLSMGQVSQCIEHDEGDYACEVTDNGPAVTEALIKMLREFEGADFDAWLMDMQG